uniref:Uncharacterized protein n=1 Tax=Rhizophora mucronata TaxID=61149 RepID=A0A2P2QWJ3_RHIMU
MQHFLRSF